MESPKGTSSVFEESVKMAFTKAKKDILTVMEDMNKLKFEMIEIRKELMSFKEKSDLMNQIIQKQSDLSHLIKEKVEKMGQCDPHISTGTSSTGNERVLNRPEELLLRHYRMHKPIIIKRKLLELVPENGIALFDLYTQLVDKEHLCGKTTFYRYVKELCDEKKLNLELDNGKKTLRKESFREIVP